MTWCQTAIKAFYGKIHNPHILKGCSTAGASGDGTQRFLGRLRRHPCRSAGQFLHPPLTKALADAHATTLDSVD